MLLPTLLAGSEGPAKTAIGRTEIGSNRRKAMKRKREREEEKNGKG